VKLSEYKPNAARHIMVYGPPKVGKSILAMQLAKYGYRLWYVDGEDSIKSAWSVDNTGERLVPDSAIENIELIRLPDTVVYPIMIETVLKIVKGGPCKICHLHGKVSCAVCAKNPAAVHTTVDVSSFTPKDVLVIDSVTQLSNSAVNHIKKTEIAANKEDIKLDWDDWAKQGFLLDRIFSMVQNAPWNCIAISHENLVEMEDKKMKVVPRMGTNNFSKTSAKYFDDVVYIDKINNKLKAFSNATYSNNIITGSRSGRLIEKENSRGLIELFE
jgi:hypothetical protein